MALEYEYTGTSKLGYKSTLEKFLNGSNTAKHFWSGFITLIQQQSTASVNTFVCSNNMLQLFKVPLVKSHLSETER